MRRTGYVWHAQYGWHDTGTYAGLIPAGGYVQPYRNFESADTKTRMAELIEVSGFVDELIKVPARLASQEDLLRVHDREHVDRIRAASDAGGGDAGDGGSPFGAGAFKIASLAAGGTIAATEAVLSGIARNAYALVRPPGHHALRGTGMGYCIFANIAIAIEWARANYAEIRRVAVVDYDVHHGNGTQSIYASDPTVLTISLHQDRLFPQDSGSLEERGAEGAVGSAINVPLPAGCGNGAYLAALEQVVIPALRRFEPDLVMVASGFDASANDPLGRMSVTASGFGAIARFLVDAAEELCDGRLVMSHEGGYSSVYVPFCGLAVLEALSGRKSGVGDPFGPIWDPSPQHQVTAAQADVIHRAAGLANLLEL